MDVLLDWPVYEQLSSLQWWYIYIYIYGYIYGPRLVQVMACCPTIPSHNLNQCWNYLLSSLCNLNLTNIYLSTIFNLSCLCCWQVLSTPVLFDMSTLSLSNEMLSSFKVAFLVYFFITETLPYFHQNMLDLYTDPFIISTSRACFNIQQNDWSQYLAKRLNCAWAL